MDEDKSEVAETTMELSGNGEAVAENGSDQPKMEVGDDETPKPGSKRKNRRHGPSAKKVKLSLPKNPLQQLNELKPGLEYHFEAQQGAAHEPLFVASVEVNGDKFTGHGRTKKHAKQSAAHAALMSFVQFQNMPAALQVLQSRTSSMDFTEDNIENEAPHLPAAVRGDNMPMTISPTKFHRKITKLVNESNSQNPIMMLNELHPGLQYVLLRENSANTGQRFVMGITVGDEQFEASGPSKKSAKADAARLALSKIYNVRFSFQNPANTPSGAVDLELFEFPQLVADKIAKLVNSTFNDIIVGNEDHAKWKVLAGIVMTRDEEMEQMEVISLGTGTKHLNGEYMSMNGAVINDCHAEVIARRCLKDYFYSQLELHVENEDDLSIFEKGANGLFHLRPNIRFHLFISTSPCGDARIFSVHQTEEGETADAHPNRKARGLLRTKIESGEGTIPVRSEQSIQTWDGIMQGLQRYLAMSCSDKMASWNILGLQGSLLSQFIEPIYFHSIVLGGLFHSDHMYRAMCGRIIPTLEKLPEPFTLHKPKMCATTTLEIRQLSKAPNSSVNWTIGLGRPEVIIAKNGKTVAGTISRLSKRSLYQRFSNLFLSFSKDAQKTQERNYATMKKMNEQYVEAKRKIVKAFLLAGLGSWVNKPSEEDDFELSF